MFPKAPVGTSAPHAPPPRPVFAARHRTVAGPALPRPGHATVTLRLCIPVYIQISLASPQSLAEAQVPVLLRHLGEGSECKGTLDFAHVVLQDVLGAEGLRQVEAVLYLETLAHGALLGAGAHGARRDPLGVSGLNAHVAHAAAVSLLPQVQVDGRQGRAGHPRVQERVRHVKHGALDVGDLVAVVAGYFG